MIETIDPRTKLFVPIVGRGRDKEPQKKDTRKSVNPILTQHQGGCNQCM